MAGFLGTETDGEVLLKGARGLGVDFFCGKGFFKDSAHGLLEWVSVLVALAPQSASWEVVF